MWLKTNVFQIFLDVFYDLAYELSWRMLCVSLKGMCILVLFGGIFYRCEIKLIDIVGEAKWHFYPLMVSGWAWELC